MTQPKSKRIASSPFNDTGSARGSGTLCSLSGDLSGPDFRRRNRKALSATVLSLFAALVFSIPHSPAAETVVVNKAFNGREIKVRAGGLIRVELEQLGAAGYSWAIKDLDKDHLEVLSDAVGDAPAKGQMTGAPVKRTWLISAKKKGNVELRFLHYRPWEGEKNASETFTLKVRIL